MIDRSNVERERNKKDTGEWILTLPNSLSNGGGRPMYCETGPDTSTGRAGNGTGNGAVDGTKELLVDSRHNSKFKRGKTELLHDTRGLLFESH